MIKEEIELLDLLCKLIKDKKREEIVEWLKSFNKSSDSTHAKTE